MLLPLLGSVCGIRRGRRRDLLCEDVLDGEDLVEELELLLGDLLIHVVDGLPVELYSISEEEVTSLMCWNL